MAPECPQLRSDRQKLPACLLRAVLLHDTFRLLCLFNPRLILSLLAASWAVVFLAGGGVHAKPKLMTSSAWAWRVPLSPPARHTPARLLSSLLAACPAGPQKAECPALCRRRTDVGFCTVETCRRRCAGGAPTLVRLPVSYAAGRGVAPHGTQAFKGGCGPPLPFPALAGPGRRPCP